MSEFEIVDRSQLPNSGPRGRRAAFVNAVVASAETKTAVRVSLNGDGDAECNRLQNSVRIYVGRHHQHLRVRSKRTQDAAFFWAEKRQ